MGNGASASPTHVESQDPAAAVLDGIASVVGEKLGVQKEKKLVRLYSGSWGRHAGKNLNPTQPSSKVSQPDAVSLHGDDVVSLAKTDEPAGDAKVESFDFPQLSTENTLAAAGAGPPQRRRRARHRPRVAVDQHMTNLISWEARAAEIKEKDELRRKQGAATRRSSDHVTSSTKSRPMRSTSASNLATLPSYIQVLGATKEESVSDSEDVDSTDTEDIEQDDDRVGAKAFSNFFKEYDTDSSGGIDFMEFTRMITSHEWASHVKGDVLERVFKSLDIDGNGYISEVEFRDWFAEFQAARMRKQMGQRRQVTRSGTSRY